MSTPPMTMPVFNITDAAQEAWRDATPDGQIGASLGLLAQLGDLHEVIPRDLLISVLRQTPPDAWLPGDQPGVMYGRTATGRHVAALEVDEGVILALPIEIRLGRAVGVDFRLFNLGVTAASPGQLQ